MIRQLILGVDAMEATLVDRMVGAGQLPALAALMARGTTVDLQSDASCFPGTQWACAMTGRNPAWCDTYFYVQFDPARGLYSVPPEPRHAPAFWHALSEAGQEVGVVDVPEVTVGNPAGFNVTNWGTHGTPRQPRTSWPPELFATLGDHPVGNCDDTTTPDLAHLEVLYRTVLDGIEAHGRLFRRLLAERPWTVFIGVFSAAHCAGHHLWHLSDESMPEYRMTPLRDALADIYVAIDKEIGRVIEQVGSDTRVMVLSPHGMEPMYQASWQLPAILSGLGYGAPIQGHRARYHPVRLAKRLLPAPIVDLGRRLLPIELRELLPFKVGMGRWQDARAFAVPNNDSVGAIRINPGKVPSDQYDSVCDSLASDLMALTDGPGGRSVVRRVSQTRRLFTGPYRDALPDLAVSWDKSFPWSTVYSSRFGLLNVPREDARTGSHSERGLLISAGPGGVSGRRMTGSVYDIAPTILEAAGVAVPPSDGRPLPLWSPQVAQQ